MVSKDIIITLDCYKSPADYRIMDDIIHNFLDDGRVLLTDRFSFDEDVYYTEVDEDAPPDDEWVLKYQQFGMEYDAESSYYYIPKGLEFSIELDGIEGMYADMIFLKRNDESVAFASFDECAFNVDFTEFGFKLYSCVVNSGSADFPDLSSVLRMIDELKRGGFRVD